MAQNNFRRNGRAIAGNTSNIDGIKLHYLSAGRGPAVILLHGYTQTCRMWRPIIPVLADEFTVIAPDLPGIGDSAIPKDGLDIKTAAICTCAREIGVYRASNTGHWVLEENSKWTTDALISFL